MFLLGSSVCPGPKHMVPLVSADQQPVRACKGRESSRPRRSGPTFSSFQLMIFASKAHRDGCWKLRDGPTRRTRSAERPLNLIPKWCPHRLVFVRYVALSPESEAGLLVYTCNNVDHPSIDVSFFFGFPWRTIWTSIPLYEELSSRFQPPTFFQLQPNSYISPYIFNVSFSTDIM